MNKKVFDFLSSFGIMALGVFLVFFFTVSFSRAEEKEQAVWLFPQAGERQEVNLISVNNQFPESKTIAPVKKENSSTEPELTAFSAAAIDPATETVLWTKDADKVRPLASITKLMTAMVLVDLPVKWNEEIMVLEEDCDSSSHHTKAGEIYTRSELWNAALVSSDNSAVRALVRQSGKSMDEFTALMNKKAKDLGLNTLHFTEPTGLDAGNVGSAVEVGKMLNQALKFDKIKNALSRESYTLRPKNSSDERIIWSTDEVLTGWTENNYNKEDVFGKTGYISDSRYNFVVSLKKENDVIVTIMGAETADARFTEALSVADWVFQNYVWNK